MTQAFHDHADHRSEFEMITIHDSTLKTFDELDEKIAPIQKQYWKGEPLPFPILIDREQKTQKMFGVSSFPSMVLIDPDGNVVGLSSLVELEKQLTPLPLRVKWARQLDVQRNIQWGWNKEPNIGETLKMFARFSQCEFAISPEVTAKFGLTSDATIPVMMEGYGMTLRSVERMMFGHYGVEFQVSDDGKSLILKNSTRSVFPPSHFQKLHNRQITDRINGQGKDVDGVGDSNADVNGDAAAEQPNSRKPRGRLR